MKNVSKIALLVCFVWCFLLFYLLQIDISPKKTTIPKKTESNIQDVYFYTWDDGSDC